MCVRVCGRVRVTRALARSPAAGPFPDMLEFGALLGSFDACGWVEAVAWSQSGARLAFASHDSSVTIVDVGAAGATHVRDARRRAGRTEWPAARSA